MKTRLLLLIIPYFSFATNYYVSQIMGDDAFNGTSPTTPFYTLQKAADFTNPGDTVFVMNGVYTNNYVSSNVLGIYNSGTPTAYITYKNYLNDTPIFQIQANNWGAISVQGADYVIVDGFTVIGNNDNITLAYAQSQQNNLSNSATSSNGIGVGDEYQVPTNKSHHVIIRNCKVSKCGGGGIYSYQVDYITIENNTISDCGWYSPYGNSGISMYQNWNSDTAAGFKNFVTGNTCFGNKNLVPFYAAGSITDGNGIIFDDYRNTQNNSTIGAYVGKTYCANNVCFNNGARGIHCYLADNVLIINNTCYKNCQSPSTQEGEFTAFDSGNISFINNIGFPDVNVPPLGSFNAPNLLIDNNIWGANELLANPAGTNFIAANPNFVLESTNPLLANFQLTNGSPAINAGISTNAPVLDKNGNQRVGAVDIGAYEYQNLILANNNFDGFDYSVYPNPAKNILNIAFANEQNQSIQIVITNILGQQLSVSDAAIINNKTSISLDNLSVGVYFLTLKSDGQIFETVEFLKD